MTVRTSYDTGTPFSIGFHRLMPSQISLVGPMGQVSRAGRVRSVKMTAGRRDTIGGGTLKVGRVRKIHGAVTIEYINMFFRVFDSMNDGVRCVTLTASELDGLKEFESRIRGWLMIHEIRGSVEKGEGIPAIVRE